MMINNLSRSRAVSWTNHARAKMNFYRLSEARVLRVLHSPNRIEEGVAPKTIAMMQPTSLRDRTWTQEIWVMVEDLRDRRTIISAWRYPGKTKPRSEISLAKMREEYRVFTEERSKKDGKKVEK
jgi:hypothetical protein